MGILKENLVERNCLVPQEWQFTEWNSHTSSNETANLLQSIKASKLLSLCFHTCWSWEVFVYGSLADLWVKTYVTVLHCSLVGCFLGAEGKDYAAFDYAVGQKFGLGGARCRVKEVLCFICFFHNYFQKNRNLLFEQRLWVTPLFFCSFNRAYFTPETICNVDQS